MAIQEGSGTIVGISVTLPTTFDDDGTNGYPSETYVTVGEVMSVPQYGSVNNVIRHLALAEIDVDKRPGSRDNGSIVLPLALDDADTGQIAIEGALRTEVAIEIQLPNGEEHYFTAYVMSYQQGVAGADSMWSASVGLEITRPVVKVAA